MPSHIFWRVVGEQFIMFGLYLYFMGFTARWETKAKQEQVSVDEPIVTPISFEYSNADKFLGCINLRTGINFLGIMLYVDLVAGLRLASRLIFN